MSPGQEQHPAMSRPQSAERTIATASGTRSAIVLAARVQINSSTEAPYNVQRVLCGSMSPELGFDIFIAQDAHISGKFAMRT